MPPRLAHTCLTQIIREEGVFDRDSVLREGPYVSLVPTSSPWNTMGTDIIGFHNPNEAGTSPTLISPQRYARLHAAHSRLNQGTDFLQDLKSLMLIYDPRAEPINPQGKKYKPSDQCPPPRPYNGPSSSHFKRGRKFSPAPSTAPWSRRASPIAPHTIRTPSLEHHTTQTRNKSREP